MEFGQLALLLVVAAIFGVISTVFRQPLLVGYIFAGFLLSVLNIVPDSAQLESFSQIGVTLLLFLLGLEMNIKELPSIGKPAVMAGVGQIIFTFIGGFVLCMALGYDVVTSSYVSIALTFSSTIIIVKLLSEKRDLQSLYGRISIGLLLVQDFVAVLILIFLSSMGRGDFGFSSFVWVLLKIISLSVFFWYISKNIIPKIVDRYISKNPELIYVFSIAWAIGVSSVIANYFGFTLEIGGFLAGLALSNTAEHLQISARAKPLRDFFLTIFFVHLGTKLGITGEFLRILVPGILLSFFVLVANPVIVMFIMGKMGYKKRTAFYASLSTAQISEFSLIIMAMGSSLGHFDNYFVSLVTLVGVVTMTISTYMVLNSQALYKYLSNWLSIFESDKPRENAFIVNVQAKNHIILIGCDRSGSKIIDFLKRKNLNFVVVDFNPNVFSKLTAEKTPVIFGDIDDPEIQNASGIEYSRLLISTTSDLVGNLSILESLKKLNRKAESIFVAQTRGEGLKLYEAGATLVIIPELSAGELIKQALRSHTLKGLSLEKLKRTNFDRLLAS